MGQWDFEIDEDAPQASPLDTCLEENLEYFAEYGSLISRSMGGSRIIPRMFVFESQDGRKWKLAEMGVGVLELMPKGFETLREILVEPLPAAKFTARFWLVALPPENPGPNKTSGKYLMLAGCSDGALRHMLYVEGHWSSRGTFDEFMARIEAHFLENLGTSSNPAINRAVDATYKAMCLAVDEGKKEDLQAAAAGIVRGLCSLYDECLQALAMQASNQISVVQGDLVKETKKTIEDLERDLRNCERARATLQKDFDKIKTSSELLRDQRNKLESEVRSLKVAVPNMSAQSGKLNGKTVAERLDQLF